MRRLGTVAIALTVMLALAGCTGSTSQSTDSGGSAPAVGAPVPARGDGPVAGEGATSNADRQVISIGNVSITAEDPIGAADAAAKLVEGAGGRIDSRSEQPAPDTSSVKSPIVPPEPPPSDGPSAQLVVRIPAAALTVTLAKLKKLGTVEYISINATDVTAQSKDLDARISALRASVDRLLGLLAGATTTKDLIDIETALSARQADLESLESQQRGLRDQVDLATITLSFASNATAPTEKPTDFFSGVSVGWQTLVGFLNGAIVVIGFLLPWLIAVALLGLLAFVLLRLSRRRRRAAFFADDSPSASAPGPTVPDNDPASFTMEE